MYVCHGYTRAPCTVYTCTAHSYVSYAYKHQGHGYATPYTDIQPLAMYHEIYDGHDLILEVQWKVLSQTNSTAHSYVSYAYKHQGHGYATPYTDIQPLAMYHEIYDGHDLILEVQWKVLSQTNSCFQFLCFSGHFRSSANTCTGVVHEYKIARSIGIIMHSGLAELFGSSSLVKFFFFFFFYNNSAKCMDTLVAYYANLMCALIVTTRYER